MQSKETLSVVICRIALIAIGVGGGVWTLRLFSSAEQLTSRESTLLGIILTICSTIVGWMITHIYSSSQTEAAIDDVVKRSQANLRMYALKAAEKVNNLSNQLSNLAAYLEQELAEDDETETRQALFAREERMYSAIHLIKSLKASNDTSLSDWEGVIGDELSQQREERLEKEEQLKNLVERVEFLSEDQSDTEELKREVEHLRRDLRLALSSLSSAPALSPKPSRISSKSQKVEVQGKCPFCDAIVKYRQRPKAASTKAIPCPTCSRPLFSRWDVNDGFVLARLVDVPAEVSCPNCAQAQSVSLSPLFGATAMKICKCGASFRLSRTTDGELRVRSIEPKRVLPASPVELTEDLIESIMTQLPAQPWPTGTAKEVARKLNVSPGVIDRAIRELVKRGRLFYQVEGQLYQQVSSASGQIAPSPKDAG